MKAPGTPRPPPRARHDQRATAPWASTFLWYLRSSMKGTAPRSGPEAPSSLPTHPLSMRDFLHRFLLLPLRFRAQAGKRPIFDGFFPKGGGSFCSIIRGLLRLERVLIVFGKSCGALYTTRTTTTDVRNSIPDAADDDDALLDEQTTRHRAMRDYFFFYKMRGFCVSVEYVFNPLLSTNHSKILRIVIRQRRRILFSHFHLLVFTLRVALVPLFLTLF